MDVWLEKCANCLTRNIEADDAARSVDLLDRRGWNEPASAGEETGADGERVRDVGRRAVHRTLDPPHDPSTDVRNEIADRGAEVEEGGCFGHKLDVTPAVSAFFALSVRSV